MNAEELKEIQSPLKARYREDPAAAMITLKAEGRLGSEAVTCSVATGRAMVEAGLHPATGGDGRFACSGDMLLQALVACAGVTLRSVAINRGLEVEGVVRAEGDLDFRGTLGVDRNAAVGFRSIRLSFDLTSPASEDEIKALVETTERYCVVLQTLVRSPRASNLNVTVEGRPSVAQAADTNQTENWLVERDPPLKARTSILSSRWDFGLTSAQDDASGCLARPCRPGPETEKRHAPFRRGDGPHC